MTIPTATSIAPDRVGEIRAFNRFYTGVIGVLGESLLHTPYTLTEARVIFELAQRASTEVVDLRRSLGLDPGYLSRILTRFSTDGLIHRERSDVDARRQVIALTEAGRAAYRLLDERAAAEVRALLDRLDEAGQRRLFGAMAAIRQLLAEPDRTPSFLLRPVLPGDLGWVLQRHGEIYAREYGWDASFEALVARIVADYGTDRDPAREDGWVAEVDGQRAGFVCCVQRVPGVAQLRLLLVDPPARGAGIGGRLVEECLRFARGAGYRRIVLWTYDVLADAGRIYQRAGFRLAREEREHSYGRDLTGQEWERDL